MITVLFQKTATNELWWIGMILGFVVVAWTVLSVLRYFRIKRQRRLDEEGRDSNVVIHTDEKIN